MISSPLIPRSLLGVVLSLVIVATTRGYAFDNYNCDPCIDRPSHSIKAIVHGHHGDPFWRQVQAAAVQAAKDMRIQLDFDLYTIEDPISQMVQDIRAASTTFDALLVSTPNEAVSEAMHDLNVPVFGINSGYSFQQQDAVAWVGMDDYVGGQEAAKQFLLGRQGQTISRALYINHAKGHVALDRRFQGFQDALLANATNLTSSLHVEEIEFHLKRDKSNLDAILTDLTQQFADCPHDVVLLAGADLFELVLHALKANGCDATTSLGTFDVSAAIYQAIATSDALFAISQQPYLQGALGVTLAALYATTGKSLSPSVDSSFGMYATGPIVVTFDTLPLDTHQVCELDAFPVCPNTKALDGISDSKCDCIDRSNIRIGGATHGLEIDPFWKDPMSHARQAARDLGVTLLWELTKDSKNEINDDITYAKMSNKILSFCREGYHGVFVSLSNRAVLPAVQECQALHVPILSINSGAEAAQEIGLVHIAQSEYVAGFEAGKRMLAAGVTAGICPNPRPMSTHLTQRCNGMRDAIRQANQQGETTAVYLDMPAVPADSLAQFIVNVEEYLEAIGLTGDWDGLGMLMISAFMLEEALTLQDRHPKLRVATFDKSDQVFDAIGQGRVLFGIDQGSSMQGYMPVWLLTMAATTTQHLVNEHIQSGPSFVAEEPSPELKTCEANFFEVCPPPIRHDFNHLTWVRPIGYALAAIVVFSSLLFAAWQTANRAKPLISSSQPVFLNMICLGTLIMGLAIFPMGIDDGIASEETCSKACMSTMWLFTIGFTVAFAGIICKLWRINLLLQNAVKFKRSKITVWRVMVPLIGLVSINVVLLLIWTILDPMHWKRQSDCGSSGESSYGYCTLGKSSVSKACLGLVLTVNLFALVLASLQAYKARGVSLQFSESRWIFMIIIGILQITVIAVPVIILVLGHPTASFFVRSAFLFVLCMTILLLLFVPKIRYLRKEAAEKDKDAREDDSVASSRSRPSKIPVPKAFKANADETFFGSAKASSKKDVLKKASNSHSNDASSDGLLFLKVMQLDELLRKDGIDTVPLLKEVGIDLPAYSNVDPIRPSFSDAFAEAIGFPDLSGPVSNKLSRPSAAQAPPMSGCTTHPESTPPNLTPNISRAASPAVSDKSTISEQGVEATA